MVPSCGTLDRASLVARLGERALFVRTETVRLARIAGAGHYTASFSAAELFAALYYAELRYDPGQPDWPDRDRFVLSKGHAAIGLYPLLADVGFFDRAELENYTRLGSAFGDHPDMKRVPGIDFSSGSLGHGLSVAVGMALAARMRNAPYRTWCMLGDGELHEGQVWEAVMSAAHYQLGSLVALVDSNGLCIDGHTRDVMSVEPLEERFGSFGWKTRRFDGHDLNAILDVFATLPEPSTGQPIALIADTVKGQGVKRMEHNPAWHVGNLVGDDYDEVLAELRDGVTQPEVAQ